MQKLFFLFLNFISGLSRSAQTFSGTVNQPVTYTEDMTVKLQAPNGMVIMLFAGVGGAGDDFTNTCLEGVGPSLKDKVWALKMLRL